MARRRAEARQDRRAARRRTRSSACARARRSASSTSRSTPGTSKADLRGRRHDAAREQSSEPLEFEDLFSTFDARDARQHRSAPPTGFGDAFAGRGRSINSSIEALNPFFTAPHPGDAEPVRPAHRARPVLPADRPGVRAGRAGRPHAGRCCSRTWPTRSRRSPREPARAPGHDREGRRRRSTSRSSRSACSSPFLADFTDLSARLRPGGRAAAALASGDQQRLRGRHAGPAAHGRAEREPGEGFGALDDLFQNPSTLLALKDLDDRARGHAVRRSSTSRPTRRSATTSTTSSTHWARRSRVVQSGPTGGGTVLNQNMKEVNQTSRTTTRTSSSSRPWDILEGQNPQGAKDVQGKPLYRLYAPAYNPAIDAQGNADCQLGQTGYPNGTAGPGPLQAGRHQGRLGGPRPADPGRVRFWQQRLDHRATTCPASQAAPTSRVSSASTT